MVAAGCLAQWSCWVFLIVGALCGQAAAGGYLTVGGGLEEPSSELTRLDLMAFGGLGLERGPGSP